MLTPEVMAKRDTEYSPEFHHESQALGSVLEKEEWRPSPKGPVLNRLRGTFAGRQFSCTNGERTTSYSSGPFTNEVFCLGGSTTFCIEVRDGSTWPSVLQRMIAESNGAIYKCRNLGIPGTPGLERIWALRYATDLQRGDIAVLLFGDNDSGWKMYGNREGMYLDNMPRLLRLLHSLADILELGGWLYGELAPRYLRRLAVEMAETTIAAAEDAAEYARSNGANVLFVLQPNIFTLARPDNWDRKIIAGTARDLPIMLAAAYQRYREWVAESPIAVDATHIFNGESPSPYMGDWGHVNTRGNKLIGEFVFDQLKTRGLLAPAFKLK
jgi:lysophospholipase L1-like esterase